MGHRIEPLGPRIDAVPGTGAHLEQLGIGVDIANVAVEQVEAEVEVWLGAQALRTRDQVAFAAAGAVDGGPRPARSLLRDGLQMVVLGLVFVVVAVLSDSAWGLAAGTAREWLVRSPKQLARLNGAGGLVMVSLGLRLALTGRTD